MAQIITNQASLNFQYNGQSGTAVSNLATAVIDDPFTVDKNSVTETYRAGEALTYTVSIVNNGASAQNDITVSDDLGAFAPGTFPIVPLDYLPPALLYINGESQGTLTGDVGEDGVTFTIPSLAAGANALIVYRAIPNERAPLAAGSEITNTVTVTSGGSSATASETVTVEEAATVSITKAMEIDGREITYTFGISNSGNSAATELVLTDAFDPAPTDITVSVDGEILPAGEYTYENGTLTLPLGTLDAATVTTDPATGIVTVTPSTVSVVVTGTL